MQRGFQALFSQGNVLKAAVLRHARLGNPAMRPLVFACRESTSAARIDEHGFESTTISDVLKSKGEGADGSWLWCTTDDTVYDAVKSMTHHNVGALVVVKPGEQKSIAGIITERDYLRKIIVQGRSSKTTKVGDIMTEEINGVRVTADGKDTDSSVELSPPSILDGEDLFSPIIEVRQNKLITVAPHTKVVKAMQLMTDNRIRHIPVIDDSGMVGMVSIGDVVRAVVIEHRDELNRLNAYIQGGY